MTAEAAAMGGDPGAWAERYADLAARVRRAPARLGPVRLVAVDGPAGAGKTTFAGRLAAALTVAGSIVEEIHTDDLLAGWTDIVSFWPRLDECVLAPLRRGQPGSYRRFDWSIGRFAELVAVPVPDVLVLEGVTSARAVIRPELTLSVFVVAPRELRLERGIRRDGPALRPQWLRWSAEEDAHFAGDSTVESADLLVDGAPSAPHDPPTEYLRRAFPGGRSGEQQSRGGKRS
jgi:hypothetical protein